MKDVKYYLDLNKEISGYRVYEKRTESYELFFVHEKAETVRATDTVSSRVTVYVDHDGKTGDSDFDVYASMTENDIKDKIAKAVERAKLVFNEPYSLVSEGTEDKTLASNIPDYDKKELACEIADAVFSSQDGSATVNALEIFIYKDVLNVINSRGVDKKQTSYSVMIEAIPTDTEDGGSVELYEAHWFNEFDKESVKREISEKISEAKARYAAVKPEDPLEIDVLLRPNEIKEMLWEIADDLDYATVYTKSNMYKIGDDLQKDGKGDKLNVTLRGRIDGSVASAYFDRDGKELSDRTVIENGVVRSFHGTNRFGQYLKEKDITGELGCIELSKGTFDPKERTGKPYLDVVSMSGLQIDLYNDYIGGEIRLAYYFDGKTTVPVTGISMSGSLSAALKTLRISKDLTLSGSYYGPDRIMLENMKVV